MSWFDASHQFDDGSVASVADMPVCAACGLMSGHLVSEKNPICPQCFDRLNWAYAQGPWRYLTEGGETYHETPLCPALRTANDWGMTREEHVYLDRDQCKRCRRASMYGFDHYRGQELVV